MRLYFAIYRVDETVNLGHYVIVNKGTQLSDIGTICITTIGRQPAL